jgi:hypothetical protein
MALYGKRDTHGKESKPFGGYEPGFPRSRRLNGDRASVRRMKQALRELGLAGRPLQAAI